MGKELVRRENTQLVELSPFEQQQVDKLRGLIKTHAVRTLEWWWDVGEIVAAVYSAAEKNKSDSGRERVKAISAALNMSTERNLLDAMQLVERWKTRKRYQELIDKCTDQNTGAVLSFAHVRELSRVNDDRIVMNEAANAIKNNLSCATLRQRLAKYSGNKGKKRGPGRPMGVVTDLEQCLAIIERTFTRLKRLIGESWMGKTFDVTRAIRDGAKDLADSVDSVTGKPMPERLENIWALMQDVQSDLNSFVKAFTAALNKLDTAIGESTWEEVEEEEPDDEDATDSEA